MTSQHILNSNSPKTEFQDFLPWNSDTLLQSPGMNICRLKILKTIQACEKLQLNRKT